MPRPRPRLVALGATFVVNGIGWPSLLPRYPQLADAVGASEAAFGLALVGAGVGGLAGGVLAPVLARRLPLVDVVRVGGLALGAAMLGVAWSSGVVLLAVGLAGLGAADALHDVAMNEIALGEQQGRGRSIMGRLHGLWSVGATTGGAVGALLAGLRVPVTVHAGVMAVIAVAVQLAAARVLARDGRPGVMADAGKTDAVVTDAVVTDAVVTDAGVTDAGVTDAGVTDAVAPAVDPSATPPSGPLRLRRLTSAAVGVAVAATLAAMVAEITPQEWSALLLRRELGTGPGLAGLGPVVFAAGILLGRTVTDPLVDRLGPLRLLRWANLAAAAALGAGLVVAAATGSGWPLLAGLGVAGMGVSADFPLMFGAGDVIAMRLDLPAGTGTSAVGTLARFGGLFLPAVVGVVAQSAGLLVALGLSVLASLAAAVLLPRLVAPLPAR